MLAAYSSEVKLQTYFRQDGLAGLYGIETCGVTIDATSREEDILFSYLHPLANPHLIPRKPKANPPIKVDGSAVLRFGFVEGDSIVTAQRAVYDPQSLLPVRFAANGSHAARLAVVLNQAELAIMGESADMGQAVQRVVEQDRAEVVVVKCGAAGAWVFTSGEELPAFVPAFRSEAVFKIGTGDVFSAIFAHYWCEKGEPPAAAAFAASKAVASYAQTRSLRISPIKPDPVMARDVNVAVVGFGNTLADIWLREETCSALLDLGVRASQVPSLEIPSLDSVGSLLILADGNLRSSSALTRKASRANIPTIVFQQSRAPLPTPAGNLQFTDDFCTAVYWAIWMAARPQQSAPQSVHPSRRKRG
ncbi:PfkB family carbohydrate kinase [Bradyrhizobium sp. DASA03076]|uniref:PfkB family carbohydrate kinase n=1 Tax=Bradyrhizobium sp. BLXBL-03 TaxID=3395916 RepID=UPI003F6EA147